VPGVRIGTGLAGLLTSVKFLALGLIVLVALALRKGSAVNFEPVNVDVPLITAIGVTMAAILWTFDGWADVGSISGEVQNPRRVLPRIFIAGVASVTALYLAVNAVFMWMLPMAEMGVTATVAPVVAERLIGGIGGIIVTALVVVSTLGSSHASIITGARVTFAQARDGLLFRTLGRIHPRYHTPATALWVQCGLSIAAVWTLKTFENLANGFVFTMWIFYGLAGVALLLVRRGERDSEAAHAAAGSGAFRCPGYPFVPVVFVLSALGMTVLSISGSPGQTLPWLGVLAAGWPMYYLWMWVTTRRARGAA
jgi:APA family basic amino acid/polyamine antiporter